MINRSKAYLAPLVLKEIRELPFSMVENTFIFSDFRPLEPTLYCLVDKEMNQIEKLQEYISVEGIFDIGSHYLIVTILDSRYHYEYLCFKRGNYSWYTPEAKMEVLNYLMSNLRKKPIVDKVRAVFSKDPILKKYYEKALDVRIGEDMELSSRMNKDKETFNSIDYEQFTKIWGR